MLASLAIVVAAAGGFVGALYGGLIPLGRTTTETKTQFSILTHEQPFYITQTVTQRVTQTVTQQAGRTTATTQRTTSTPVIPAGPYVLIAYSGEPYSGTILGSRPPSGYTFLIVSIKAENHGYDRVYVSPSYFYVIIGSQQFKFSGSTFWLENSLSATDVFNGLSVSGVIAYEVPTNYGTFELFWDHPSDVNVQYVHQSGQTTVTQGETAVTQEQVILQQYDWTNPSYLIITLKNVGQASVTFSEFYVNDARQNMFAGNCPSKLPPQQKCIVSITITAVAIVTGASYPLKIVTSENSVFSYSVIAGAAA